MIPASAGSQSVGVLVIIYIRRKKMRHFLSVTGAVAGNFILWSLITKLPVHPMIIFCLVIAVGCLMIYLLVLAGKAAHNKPSAKS